MSSEREPRESDLARWRRSSDIVRYTQKSDRSYLPSYDWGDLTLNDRHPRIADAAWDVPGWLSREDAMKLYELAYFAAGPILEIGTFCGKSAITMALALDDAERPGPVVSVDNDPRAVILAHEYIRAHGVADLVILVCQSVSRFLAAIPTFRPSLVFVDGDHSAAAVRADLDALAPCLLPGTLVLFHDYLPADDIPNASGFARSPEPIEVREALRDSWLREHAEFAGTFGWSGLFRISSTPSRPARVGNGGQSHGR